MPRRKFGNVRVAGFDSKREYRHVRDLQLKEKLGLITNLSLQVKYELTPKMGTERASHYVADAVYEENGKTVVLDVKGFRTPLYVLKRKMLRHRYGIVITEV